VTRPAPRIGKAGTVPERRGARGGFTRIPEATDGFLVRSDTRERRGSPEQAAERFGARVTETRMQSLGEKDPERHGIWSPGTFRPELEQNPTPSALDERFWSLWLRRGRIPWLVRRRGRHPESLGRRTTTTPRGDPMRSSGGEGGQERELGPGTRLKMNLPETGMNAEGSQLSRDPRGPPTSRRTPK
jgi:hypothetical protein